MDKKLSYKLVYVKYVLCILIVIRHAMNFNIYGSANQYMNVLHHFGDGISACAVPAFFTLSAMLFYRNLTEKNVVEKLKRRVKTLLIPYLIFNSFAYFVYLVISRIEPVREYLFLQLATIGISDTLNAVFNATYTPLWFVRDLMVFSLLSVIICRIIKNKWVYAIFFFAVSILCEKFSGLCPIILTSYLPLYLVGAYVGYYHFDSVMKTEIKPVITIVAVAVFGFLMFQFSVPGLVFKLYEIASGYAFILAVKSAIKEPKEPKFMYTVSFFIYCTHYPFLMESIKAIYFNVFGITAINALICFIITVLLSVAFLTAIAYLLKRYCSPIWNILVGQR